jgi:type I restriction enzyme S subunit
LNDGFINNTEETITRVGLENSNAKIFPAGTLLIALYGATVGKLGVLYIDAATNQAICAITPSGEIDREYLFFYLLLQRDNLLKISFGGAQPNISQEIIRSIEIPIPLLPEQRRIAAILNEQMSAIERARAAAEAQLEATKALLAAYLRRIFENAEAKRWHRIRLGDVIADAQPGFACGERDSHGVIQLRMNNVNTRGNLVWDRFIRVPADPPTITRYQLISGDVVFNNTNSTELVGKSALFLGHSEPVVYSNHFTRLRSVPDKLVPAYLAIWLLQQWQSRVFEGLCNRWIGQSAVKNDKLLSLEIPLPSLTEQQRITAILNERMSTIDRARISIETQLPILITISNAILQQAFNGEL